MDRITLNIVYDLYLQFGPERSIPLEQRAQKVLQSFKPLEIDSLCQYIKNIGLEIENYIYDKYNNSESHNTLTFEIDIKNWVKSNYPWIDDKNLSHSYSQNIYFAIK